MVKKTNTPRDGGDTGQKGPQEGQRPGALNTTFALSADIMERLGESMRPRRVEDVPGAEVMGGISPEIGRFWPIPPDWRIAHASVPATSAEYEEIKTLIESKGGKIVGLPFSSAGKMDVLAMFPNDRQTKEATMLLRGINGVSAGMQVSEEIYGGVVEGRIAFVGDGVKDAMSNQMQDQVSEGSDIKDISEDFVAGVDPKALLPKLLDTPESLSRTCAVAEVRFESLKSLPPEESRGLIKEIMSLVDSKLDVFEWYGNTIKIVSTREQAGGYLSVELRKILDKYKNVDFVAAMSQGELNVKGYGEKGRSPRAVQGDVFAEVGKILPATGAKRGLFVSEAEYARLDGPRGISVNLARRHPNGSVELKDIDYQYDEEKIGGPKKMIGRNADMRKFYSARGAVRRGETKMFTINGGPGIGKSRFAKECRMAMAKETGNIVSTKAYEHDKEAGFVFVKNFIKALLEKNASQEGSEAYELLKIFESGEKTGNDVVDGRVQSLYMDPREVAGLIAKIIKNADDIFFGLFDDLQWCDNRSIPIIAELIKTIGKNDKAILFFSSRSGQDTLPLLIKQALEVVGKEDVNLNPLQFLSETGEPTSEIRDYVLHSLPLTSVDGKTVPTTFLLNLAKSSGGVPFAATYTINDLVRRGVLGVNRNDQVEVRGDVDFADYTGRNLYENMIQRMTEGEVRVYKALVLFGGEVSLQLFRSVMKNVDRDLVGMERKELITISKGKVKIAHDLLLETANGKLGQGADMPDIAWDVYGIVRALAESPELRGAIDHTMLYNLISRKLKTVRGEDREMVMAVFQAAIAHGAGAIEELEAIHRSREAYTVISEMINVIGANNMTPNLQYNCLWRLAKIYLKMENKKGLEESLGKIKKLLDDPRANLAGNGTKHIRLYKLMCDAGHLSSKPDDINSAATQLEKQYDTTYAEMVRDRQGERFSQPERMEVLAAPLAVKLSQAREEYHRAEQEGGLADKIEKYERVMQLCEEVEDYIKREGLQKGSIEYEKLYMEAVRFWGVTAQRAEEARRGFFDGDVVYLQDLAEEDEEVNELAGRKKEALSKATLEKGMQKLQEAVRLMRSGRPLMDHPKQLIGALSALGRMVAFFVGGVRGMQKGIDHIKEAKREAGNFGEIGELSRQEQVEGNMIVNWFEMHNGESILNMAIEAFEKGAAEILQTPGGRGEFMRYANLCNAARARTLWVQNFAVPENIQEKVGIALRQAEDAAQTLRNTYGNIAPDYVQGELGHYVWPSMGHLLKSAGENKVLTRDLIPNEVRVMDPDDIQRMIDRLQESMREAAGNDPVTKELAWKIEGLEALLTLKSGKRPEETTKGYEDLEGLDD
jgi:hypothetical protein